MRTSSLTRREFVRNCVGLAAVAGVSSLGVPGLRGGSPAKVRQIRLGGPCFARSQDPGEIARWHRQAGYRAAYCPSIPLKDGDRIRAFAEAFAREGVVIAEVGRWVNLLDRDAARAKDNLETVTEGLALAEAIGALCCVDIAGSRNSDVWYGPHPDNFSTEFFDAAVENARKIIDAVKPKRAKFSYEMMGWAIPESPNRYLKLLRAVDRPAFAVHFDPCNLVNSPDRFYRNADLLRESFAKLGRWIVSCHAKDLKWVVEMNVHFQEVRPGAGSMDYVTYLKELAALPQAPPLMIEHLPNEEEYVLAARYIRDTGERLGLSF